jgi:hypothetical protein
MYKAVIELYEFSGLHASEYAGSGLLRCDSGHLCFKQTYCFQLQKDFDPEYEGRCFPET